jgi:hypothetical protein
MISVPPRCELQQDRYPAESNANLVIDLMLVAQLDKLGAFHLERFMNQTIEMRGWQPSGSGWVVSSSAYSSCASRS